MKPSESESVSTLPPRAVTFSAAWVATLPEREITTFLPLISSFWVASMFCRK